MGEWYTLPRVGPAFEQMLPKPPTAGETVEPHVQPKQAWSPLQFARPALTPLTIPSVHPAVRAGMNRHYMLEHGHEVDFRGHSALCLEALKGGLIQQSDLAPLIDGGDGYGLHLVTSKVLRAVESGVTFSLDEAITDPARMVADLARPFVDIKEAASVALAVTESGLMSATTLRPILANGPDCGFELQAATKAALDGLWPLVNREERIIDEGDVYTYEPFDTFLAGGNFYLQACERNRIYLKWPEISPDFLEVHIILCKTLDAMSHYLVPFHTPASAYGHWGQYSYGPSEGYDELKELIQGRSREEISEILRQESAEDSEWLEMMLAEYSIDDGQADYVAELMWQMDDIANNFTYMVGRRDSADVRAEEINSLKYQARAISEKSARYETLCEALFDALEICSQQVDSHQDIASMICSEGDENSEYEGFEKSPDRFFNCIWVMADERHDALARDALDSFNADLYEVSDVHVKLPLATVEEISAITVPVLHRTNSCMALLKRIQHSLESLDDA